MTRPAYSREREIYAAIERRLRYEVQRSESVRRMRDAYAKRSPAEARAELHEHRGEREA